LLHQQLYIHLIWGGAASLQALLTGVLSASTTVQVLIGFVGQ
jgi:hypothetical protein